MATIASRKADRQRILETYAYEHRKKAWGALSRTATIYHLSVETIRRYVKEAEGPEVLTADDLVYVPCPGERPIAPRELSQPAPRKLRNLHTIRHSQPILRYDKLCRATRSDVRNVTHLPPADFHSGPLMPDTRPWPELSHQPSEDMRRSAAHWPAWRVNRFDPNWRLCCALLFVLLVILVAFPGAHAMLR